jgi:predicted regulator of Ras-like GTPase activity (Roadblock/LC7/MglB family)
MNTVMLSRDQLAGYAEAIVGQVPGVRAVVVLSTDGLMLTSAGCAQEQADKIAAFGCGMIGMALSAGSLFALQDLTHILLAYADGNLAITAVNDRCALAVLAAADANLSNLVYEMTLFGEQHGDAISPDVRTDRIRLPERT